VHAPALRRWGTLLLGALVFIPAGLIAALGAGDVSGRVLGVVGAAFGVYLAAGAFFPRLLRFGGRRVPLPVVVLVVAGAANLAEGRAGWGALCLTGAIFVAVAGTRE
jgi:hypothetical protein